MLEERQKQLAVLLDELSDEIALDMRERGFYNPNANKGEMIALMHSELSECLEAIRHDPKLDEHCPEFTNELIELADTVIRILHYAGRFKLAFGDALIAKFNFNKTRPFKHGKKF